MFALIRSLEKQPLISCERVCRHARMVWLHEAPCGNREYCLYDHRRLVGHETRYSPLHDHQRNKLHQRGRQTSMGPLHESGHISNSQSKVQTANQRWRWIVCLAAQVAVSSCAYTTDRVEACQREKGATDTDIAVTCGFVAVGSSAPANTPELQSTKERAVALGLLNCANTILKNRTCEK